MKRIISVFAVAALMAIMVMVLVTPAFAAKGGVANGNPPANYHTINSGTAHAYNQQGGGNTPCSRYCS
jgi:hypothetical protein